MTKLRRPESLEAALDRAKVLLGGREAAADAAGVSTDMWQKLYDPDSRQALKVWNAVKLDQECLREHGEAPIHRYYKRKIGVVQLPEDGPPLVRGVAQLAALVGQLADEACTAVSPDSNGGEAVTAVEWDRIFKMIPDIRRQLDRIERSRCRPKLVSDQ